MLFSELFNAPITPQPTTTKQSQHRRYISKNEIKTIAVVLVSMTLLKREKEFENDFSESKSSHSIIDVKDKKIIEYYDDYKEKEQEFFLLAQKILKHYAQIDETILDKARKHTAKYIEKLFGKLANKNFTIKGITFVFLYAYFCSEFATQSGLKADDKLFGKFKKVAWYDKAFDYLYNQNDYVDFWEEIDICKSVY